MTDYCAFVNPLCPDDLCVLEYGHPFTSRRRHITGTTYGSAGVSRDEQMELLRDESVTGWEAGYMAPRGTSVTELIHLGWKEQERLGAKKAGR